MKRFNPFNILTVTLLAMTLWACNADNEDEEINSLEYTNVSVKSFSLEKNDSLLSHLDTVYFSIDLDNARIFNADSLPQGVKPGKLCVKIGLPAVSKAMLYYMGDSGRDSTNYLSNSTDSVNFAHGPVTLSLVSADGTVSRDYTIQINVHKMNPDSLEWARAARRDLPTSLAIAEKMGAVEWQGNYYCLTSGNGRSVMAKASTPAEEEWTMSNVTLPTGAVERTLTATSDAMYLLDKENNLHRSTDAGQSWQNVGVKMSHIYGGYGDQLLGTIEYAGRYVALSYPDRADAASAPVLPTGCPVSGTSNSVTYTTEWAAQPMLMVAGGRTAADELTGSTWAYDGGQWSNITIDGAVAREGVALIPYYAFRSDAYWTVTEYSVLLALGGSNSDGVNDKSVWISYDRGIHWTQAPASLALPSYIPAMKNIVPFVASSLITSRSNSVWQSLEPRGHILMSRADHLITEWECPYIYLVGGETNGGNLINQMWRGAINRLTFKPLQ